MCIHVYIYTCLFIYVRSRDPQDGTAARERGIHIHTCAHIHIYIYICTCMYTVHRFLDVHIATLHIYRYIIFFLEAVAFMSHWPKEYLLQVFFRSMKAYLVLILGQGWHRRRYLRISCVQACQFVFRKASKSQVHNVTVGPSTTFKIQTLNKFQHFAHICLM